MTLTDETMNLVLSLEEYIGKECYNPKSYNGYTMVEGLSYRYPVTITVTSDDGIDHSYSTKYILLDDKEISTKTIDTLKYQFGSNHLYVGRAIVNLLSALEERYGIDFVSLEKELSHKGESQQ